ncbi:DUF2927 domain-containing protein [Aliiroseovarius subalbicans]|uniref:DUF2927 domain-containing protein n=1 Tax=Aliiroseovarius subalbicans TaxID=2925840 RepID=UPI001F5898A9|nr:DUF2927 domain-containing protein [Aliiroseovarius subalbicans]MCI2398231.1 DUF2927 domain-containing protein [Aliiroseovarius subalbicans]
MRRMIFPALLALSACMQAPNGTATRQAEITTRQVASLPSALPPMKAFAGSRIAAPARPNGQIASDFLDLAFSLESGRALPVLTRFEGPVTLRVTGKAPSALQLDLDRLLARLRVEAGIDIRQVAGTQAAGITLEVITKRQLQRLVPHAACFVAPNVASWDEFRKLRGTPATDWTAMTSRKRMAVFIPGDIAPQEMRDCLHEEVAQALGPVNDLYRLNDSVFNDDNFHTVLTGFDMLVLRAYYSRDLRSGMSKSQVAARLPGILARLNPAGGDGTPGRAAPTPTAWKKAIETALGATTNTTRRRSAAQDAVHIARTQGWYDTRLAFSLYALGRLSLGVNSDVALQAFREAETIYSNTPGSALQAAHMGVQLAAYALSAGQAERAIGIVNTHVSPVMQAENAALLSTLLMIKAEALELAGRGTEAQLVRLDSLGWARYGFGSDAQVGERLREIAAISPS